jgi:hypothetical protein
MVNKLDIQFLKWPLILFSVAILLSAGFIFAGQQFEDEKLNQYSQVKSSLAEAQRKYKKLVEDIDLLDQYTKSYKDYKRSGLIGPERRLSWIETLETVNDALKLPLLTYNLAPQEEFKQPGLKIENKILVSSTPMTLQIGLLHEEDLLAVFEGIKKNIDSLFTVDSCDIGRPGKARATPSLTKEVNLQAKCLIRWVTVDVQ